MEFGKAHWRTYEQGIQKEWLLTNGIGGFASSTIIGANTRRYHGLLVAALNPPVNRHLILSKVDESLILGGKAYDLYAYQTTDFTMKGYHHLQHVTINPLPKFVYSIEDTFVDKEISMVYGENTVVVVYHIVNGSKNAKLRLTPLINFRDYHFNSSRMYMGFKNKPHKNGVVVKPTYYDIDINIHCNEGKFKILDDCWFYNMDYAVERERGLSSVEDHFIPGYFEIDVLPYEEKTISFIATVEKSIKNTDGQALIKKEKERIHELVVKSGYEDEFAKKLVVSADAFIVHRDSTNAKTIIAGYPWFTDWGRDTMIALPGLTLATKRFEDAKEILYTFSKYVKYGLIPNMFPDGGNEPPYNSVDAALWYFDAVYKYLQYTGDYTFVRESLYKGLKEIADSYMKGTKFKIKMDTDYLITAGDRGTQLTWMDAKVGDWVVTPRQGKAVEINALWYNALMIFAEISKTFKEDGTCYEELAQKVKQSFVKSFWNQDKQCLFDCLTEEYKDDKVRPNQILAVSLSYPVLEGEMAEKVVTRVWEELYTAYGLRSLSPQSNEYVGIYMGDQVRRDGAYHQGTVWTWPLGHFITAFMRVHGKKEEGRKMALKLIQPLMDHFNEGGCVGYISEIFDGDEPLIPRGCFAQAWSVGEILRAYVEDLLNL